MARTKKHLLIGHRGVGKSSLLLRIKKHIPEATCICLDSEIELKSGKSIKNIFEQQGERGFRQLELETFNGLLKKHNSSLEPVYIALGAGYEGELPKDWHVIWVKREVDMGQMFFADRPSLDTTEKSLQVPKQKFKFRDSRYQQLANEELILLEDPYLTSESERKFFQNQIQSKGYMTLLPHQLSNNFFKRWFESRKSWGFQIEWRDDLITEERYYPPEIDLFSFRVKEKVNDHIALALRAKKIDWPLEFGEVPVELQRADIIYSLHSKSISFKTDLARVRVINKQIKWAPEINSFEELSQGYRWQLENPQKRSFLPISKDGCWKWFRLLISGKQNINFVREGDGSALDQPTLLDWIEFDRSFSDFGAILGEPVKHSWTPSFHRQFFRQKNANVLTIDIPEEAFTLEHLSFLYELGLRWAAVTSPLKNKLAQMVNPSYKSMNTLCSFGSHWRGKNTDVNGLKALFSEINPASQVVVWGGGGVVASLQEVLPKASYYSHTTKKPRQGFSEIARPDVLVWAIGRKNWNKLPHFPEFSNSPTKVIDLNYTLDSPAIAYANHIGADYVSGAKMFEEQAKQQQEFWSE